MEIVLNSVSVSVVVATLVGALAALVTQARALRRLRQNRTYFHKVAVIGPPRSGKTTLITAILDRALHSRTHPDIQFDETDSIDAYSKNIRLLQRGSPVEETPTDRFFVYKFHYLYKRFSDSVLLYTFDRWFGEVKERTRIELGDFAGDYSEQLASLSRRQENSDPLFGDRSTKQSVKDSIEISSGSAISGKLNSSIALSFIDWMRNADTVMFVIDGSLFKSGNEETLSELVTDYKAIWLHILRTHLDGMSKIGRIKSVVVITKIDLIESELRTLGSTSEDWKRNFKLSVIGDSELSSGKLHFAKLAAFLKFLTKNSRGLREVPPILFTSAISPDDQSRRGIDDALDACLRWS